MALVLIETETDFDAVFWKNFFDKANIKCKIGFVGIAFTDVSIDGEKLPSEPRGFSERKKNIPVKGFTSKLSKKCQS